MDATTETLKSLYLSVFHQDNKDYLDRIEHTFLRKGLDLRKRFFCAISALTATDQPEHLRFFLLWALYEKVNPNEIYEAILQSYLFAGYPAAIEGCFALRDVLREQGISMESGETDYRVDEWRERGRTLQQNIGATSPELGEWMIVEGYGKVLGRPLLGAVERELCTVAALTVVSRKRQLLSHIKGALNVGARVQEVQEVILQTSLFINRLLTLEALELLQECK